MNRLPVARALEHDRTDATAIRAVVGDARRLITLDNVHNFRDLGGYPTEDGRSVRWGLLYRSDGLHSVTDADITCIRALDIRTVIDLRTTGELTEHGTFPVDRVHVTLIHLPVLEAIWQEAERPAHEDDHDNLVWAYRQMLDQGAHAIASTMNELALPGALPAVFHCAAGKDRTGIVAALVLAALGVPRGFIVADYALSTEAIDRMRAWAVREIPDAASRWAEAPTWMFAALPSAMHHVLDDLEHEHGSIGAYLDSVGVHASTLDQLRADLLTTPDQADAADTGAPQVSHPSQG